MINAPQDPSASLSADPAAATDVEGPRSGAQAHPMKAVPASGAANAPENPWVVTVWRRLRREPSLMVTVAYLFVSFIGLWSNYWFYRGFGLPVLEYMQASDYLVAGLRDAAAGAAGFVARHLQASASRTRGGLSPQVVGATGVLQSSRPGLERDRARP